MNALGIRQENKEDTKLLPCHLPLSLEKTDPPEGGGVGYNERTKLSLQYLK